MKKGLAIVGMLALALGAALALGSGAFRRDGRSQETGAGALAEEAARLLEDRSQHWWHGHRPPPTRGGIGYVMAPNDDLGARVDPPIYTARMPLAVAAWVVTGGRPPDRHPLGGRPIHLLDLRRRSLFAAEHIPGSLNVPGRELEESLERGELSKLDRRAVVVAFGSRWPHFEVVTKLRGRGFEAVYAMEGLEGWKAKGYPVERDEKLEEFLKVTEAERAAVRPPPPPPPPDPLAGVEPLALKALLDAGVDMKCIFVGDRKTYEDGHVPGAVHWPLHDLEKRIEAVNRNRLVVVICGCCTAPRGGPSELAARKLTALGYTRVLHLDGHMHAWKALSLPVEFKDPEK